MDGKQNGGERKKIVKSKINIQSIELKDHFALSATRDESINAPLFAVDNDDDDDNDDGVNCIIMHNLHNKCYFINRFDATEIFDVKNLKFLETK
jgi:hypothetical protein